MGGVVDAISDGLNTIGNVLSDALSAVWEGITNIWGLLWDNVLNPILGPIMGFLGFTAEDVVTVAVSYHPLYNNADIWSFKDNVVLKSALQKRGSVSDTIRRIILKGQHTSYRKYYSYGKKDYYYGLPTLELAAGANLGVNNFLSSLWQVYCGNYGYVFDSTLTTYPMNMIDSASNPLDTVNTSFWVNYHLFYNYSYNNLANTVDMNGVTYTLGGRTTVLVTRADTRLDLDLVQTLHYEDTPYEYTDEFTDYTDSSTYIGATEGVVTTVDISNTDIGELTKTTTVTTRISTTLISPEAPVYRHIVTTTTRITYEYEYVYEYVILDVGAKVFKASFTITDSSKDYYGDGRAYYVAINNPDISLNGALSNTPNSPYPSTYVDFLPVIPLKEREVWVNSDVNSTQYITSKKLAKFLGITLDDIIESIKDSNPDENLTSAAAIIIGVDLKSTDKSVLKYLHNFLLFMHYTSTVSQYEHENPPSDYDPESGATVATDPPINMAKITENLINQVFTYGYSSQNTTSTRPTYLPASAKVGESIVSIDFDNRTVKSAKRLSSTTYEEVIFYKFNAISTVSVIGTKEVGLAIGDYSKESGLILPLSEGIMLDLGLFDREAIFSQCLHLSVYAGQFVHLEWYQTSKFLGIFSFVLLIVAIVLSVFSGGASLGAYAVLMTILYAVAINLVFRFIMQKILEWYPDDVGVQVAAAVILTVAAIMLTGDTSQMSTLETVLMATTQVSSYASQAIDFQTEREQAKFDRELSAITTELDKYEDKWEELFTPNLMVKIDRLIQAETYDQFFTRTQNDDPTDMLSDTSHMTLDDPFAYGNIRV